MISRQIANAHTTFNIVCTLVWLPLIPLMVKIVTTIIRGNDKTEKAAFEPKYLDMKVIEQPAAAMVLVSKELNRLGELAESLLSDLKNGDCSRWRLKNSWFVYRKSGDCTSVTGQCDRIYYQIIRKRKPYRTTV